MSAANQANSQFNVLEKEELSSEENDKPEILDHSDLSFLMNHALDELEAEYAEEEEKEFEDQFSLTSPSYFDESKVSESIEPESIKDSQDLKEEDTEDYPREFSFLEDEFRDILTNYDSTPKKNSTEINKKESKEGEKISQKGLEKNISDSNLIDESNPDLHESEENSQQPQNIYDNGSFQSSSKKQKFGFLKGQNIFQIGLDIGSNNIKYVIARKQKNNGLIKAFGILPNPFIKDEEFDNLIEYVSKEINLKADYPNIRCAFNIYGTSIGIKRNSLPKMNAKMMKDAVSWSAKKEFGLDEVPAIIDSVKIGKLEKKGVEHDDLLIVGCDENLVSPKLEPLLSRKIIPFKITPLAITLWQLYKKSNVFDEEKTIALIEIGESKTTIAFVKHGVLEFNREIPTAGKDITEALTGTIFYDGRPYQLTTKEAEEMKIKYGFPDDEVEDLTPQNVPVSEYSVLMRPILERIGSEIQRSIDYFRENYREPNLDHVFILGGTSQLKNFISFLSEFIEPELSIFPFSKETQQGLSEEDLQVFQNRSGELAIAYSLATDYDSSLNLLPGSIKRLDKFSLIRRLLIYSALIGAILIGISSAFSFFNASNLKSQFQLLQLEYSKLEPLKQKYDGLQKTQVSLANKRNIYRKELILDNPLPATLKIIANLYPKNMAVTNIIIVNKLGKKSNVSSKKNDNNQTAEQLIERKIIRIFGVCYSPRADAGIQIAGYLRDLKKTGIFHTITVVNQNFLADFNQLKFEIVGEIN